MPSPANASARGNVFVLDFVVDRLVIVFIYIDSWYFSVFAS